MWYFVWSFQNKDLLDIFLFLSNSWRKIVFMRTGTEIVNPCIAGFGILNFGISWVFALSWQWKTMKHWFTWSKLVIMRTQRYAKIIQENNLIRNIPKSLKITLDKFIFYLMALVLKPSEYVFLKNFNVLPRATLLDWGECKTRFYKLDSLYCANFRSLFNVINSFTSGRKL